MVRAYTDGPVLIHWIPDENKEFECKYFFNTGVASSDNAAEGREAFEQVEKVRVEYSILSFDYNEWMDMNASIMQSLNERRVAIPDWFMEYDITLQDGQGSMQIETDSHDIGVGDYVYLYKGTRDSGIVAQVENTLDDVILVNSSINTFGVVSICKVLEGVLADENKTEQHIGKAEHFDILFTQS